MTFLGLEQPVAYGREQVFDPTTAQMVLNANRDYINAVYRDYQQAMADMKEFNEKYGDFTSPIQADMDWYYNNVTGRVKNFINDLYARGIDPIRSQEGRAAIARELATMPTKGIAQVRQSAADATEYLKNMAALEADGDYDPDLEKFATKGMMLDNWDTNRYGIWTRKSPLKAKSLKSLTEASFNNRTALDLTKDDVESFGMKYDPNAQYTGFAKRHLKDIADKIAPGLYGTPYFDYYRDLAKRRLQSFGIDPTEANVNAQLAQDIADSQEEYLMGPKADYSNYYKRQEIGLRAAENQLARDKFNWEKQKHRQEHPELYGDGEGNGPAPGQEGFSWVGRTYEDFVANAASDGTTNYSWYDVPKSYDAINKSIGQTQINFGKSFIGKNNMDAETVSKKLRRLSLDLYYGNISEYQYKTQKEELLAQKGGYDSVKNAYQSRFGRKIDPGTFVAWHGGETLSDNKNVIVASGYDLDRLYDQDDVVTSTMGYTKKHRGSTQTLRNTFKQNADGTEKDANGITISPTGRGYGAIQKDGAFHVYVEVKVKDADNTRTCYYDLGVQSPSRRGGAYTRNLKDRQLVTTSGNIIGKRTPFSGTSEGFVPQGDLRYNFNWNAPGEEFNLYPDYSLWGDYGPGDVRANAYLKAKATEYNSGY